ncbi:glycosyltransferase family 1 protein [Sulfobacillus sp. hq2]|uniref:Glycosyl transferase family 1 n=1 Tax=Sulfobacillus thermotolerans TaxID=338644 RepID=A0ABM6RNS7_9FIRM|nr:glycosyltransferase family 1 protein [Sulfobacillus sp. hq2]AUW93008.1 glycosyl transferase family 1 [Sulfobacillus thermotolerans]MCY0909379.1 glycosyltransferase family 1 protein [Sulfobacillus thermotolerans]POB11127.1 glycosyl transferase family 1 [Sulfobacillus sp. hq2]
MKIAIVTETWWPSTDGVVTRVTATVRELRRMGHEILIVAPEGGEAEFEGIPVKPVPTFSVGFVYGGKPWGWPTPRVTRYLREFSPDIVHVVNPFVLGIAGVWAARQLKCPLVASYHTNIAQYADFYHLGFTKPAVWGLLRLLHNQAVYNLATSAAIQNEITSHGIERVRVWRRGVDLNVFHPRQRDKSMRARLSSGNPDQIIALYVGRIAKEKGLARLLSLFQRNPSVHLALVGDGPAVEYFQERFEKTPTTFVGKLLGQELAAAYASADFFVFPSTTETLGLVLLEAMASGLPIVAAESAPSHELIDHSGAGRLFPSDQPYLLGEMVHGLIHDQPGLAVLSTKARQEAEKWGWQEPTKELVQLYEQAIREFRAGR